MAGIYVEPIKVSDSKRVGIYCRVSSHEQKTKGDLERQVGRMTTEALKRGYSIVAVFDEVGSGMNDNRKKLQKLFELVEKKEIDVVLIEHKDRLSRFCFNYLLSYFNSYGVRIEKVEEVMSKMCDNKIDRDLNASLNLKQIYRESSSRIDASGDGSSSNASLVSPSLNEEFNKKSRVYILKV